MGLGNFFINISLKFPQGKIWEFFLLDTLKLHFEHNQGIFTKPGRFFLIFKRGQGRTPPLLVARLRYRKNYSSISFTKL